MSLNPQAEELNKQIGSVNPAVAEMLSKKGKAIFFPAKGIVSQAAQAKKCKINATAGIALENTGSTMCLKSIKDNILLSEDIVCSYESSFGSKQLREKWKEMMTEKNPSLKGIEVSLPVVTSALTHGLYVSGYLFLDEGEEIILTDLYWGNYRLLFNNGFGCSINTYKTFTETGNFNINGLREKLSETAPGKKVLVFNFPNNPSGYTPTKKEQEEIKEVILESAEQGNRIVVIIDDAYFGLCYTEDAAEESIFTKLAGLHKNVLAVKIDGPTKEDYVWGFRTGFITFGNASESKEMYEALQSKTGGAVRGTVSNSPKISQSILYSAYNDKRYAEEKKEKFKTLKERYVRCKEVLESKKEEYSEYFTPLPFNSGYFMCVRLSESIDPDLLREKLLNEYSTGVIFINNLIRVAISSVPVDTIEEVFDNIRDACREITEQA